MKIVSLQLSNVLSFRYVEDISTADQIIFDEGLNIIIGENGSGKSTALEVVNFLFRRVLYKQYNFNYDFYAQRNSINVDQRRQILQPTNDQSFRGFRLDPNWNTEGLPQTIRIVIRLDEIDKTNIRYLQDKKPALGPLVGRYSTRADAARLDFGDVYCLDIVLNRNDQNFVVEPKNCDRDFGYEYLTDYHFFKELISIYNLENNAEPIDGLYESFTLISSYRNYHSFNVSVSLRDNHPAVQIRQIRSADYNRSLNANDSSEPAIFGLVRLRVAEVHFGLVSQKYDESECEAMANDLQFIKDINKRLKIVGLECKIKLLDLRTWQYRFEFLDLRRDKAISDINSLSAGQKAITHLVFEAYGRGDLKGGVVIIDEPEIHLHYQFQHEYLQVIRELNAHQNCQYILVTHSEALINSTTISSVRRFSLNNDGCTEIRFPSLTAQQKLLIRILDNTRSTYAFFAKKVVLVEGDSDRFFFKALLQSLHQELDQEIAILHVGGKSELAPWTGLFEKFGLIVYRIADLDYSYNLFYRDDLKIGLKTQDAVTQFKVVHPDCDALIEAEYSNRTYILKNGDLESYLNIGKDLGDVINFCSEKLPNFLQDELNPKSVEMREIIRMIAA
ncbi:AAA family ATPase [Acidovorax sp. ACV02]|uniref:AAA family ATPase n=1 Tax=Acidovorax sp. ACV02 TaxID=2769310 RepID=UPI001781D5B6|nr:AAA family ATPase [Acidovorax sp. ACV02]MBD9403856.1 AAA family ATPase [Acidovorax sp. ACV02]